MKFAPYKTKTIGVTEKFDINSPEGRAEYFEAKAGYEIKKIKEYLENSAFIGYLMAKKSAGKGTYARMMVEIFGEERVAHLSVGDIVRGVDEEMADPVKKKELEAFLKSRYRGFHSLDEIMEAQEGRSTKKLLPTEFILALVEREISRMGRKALLIDGFPRGLDQVSYSLFFRQLIGYRDDPDFFVLIDVPESVIDERMKYRVVCPNCHTPRNIKLLPSSEVGYDEKTMKFFLRCDNPACDKAEMVGKEGDEFGIQNIRARLDRDEELMKQALSLYGIGKVLLQNSIPVDRATELVDEYELTPAFSYEWNKASKKVSVIERPWIIENDEGERVHSLMAPAVMVSFLNQLVDILGL
ncbi:nucleoside monophosphate kinase [Patescibacteria group bacterium]|nr:nucleoside monophosphate kinase [Patescibacteria group bacterium]